MRSLISFIDFFIRKNCSITNDLRAANSVSNGSWLSLEVVGDESLFFVPISLNGVLKVTVIRMSSSSNSNNVASGDVIVFHIKMIDFNEHF